MGPERIRVSGDGETIPVAEGNLAGVPASDDGRHASH